MWSRFRHSASVATLLVAVLVLPLPSIGEEGASSSVRAAVEVAGSIVDPDGVGISGARIELLIDGVLRSSAFTGPDGSFRLPLPRRGGVPVDGVVEVAAYRLGFDEIRRIVSADELGGAPITLVLEPAPLPLPGFEITVASDRCPDRSTPDGTALWEAMVRLHPNGLDTLGAATYTLAYTDTLAAGAPSWSDSWTAPDPEDAVSPGQRGFSGRLRAYWERRVAREGYAFLVRRTDMEGSYDAWSYAPIEADFASHFGTPLFGGHHVFRDPIPDATGGWTLSFCPSDARRPGLEGVLELSPDTLLIRAEWRFRTAEPDEEAGGWTRFPGAAFGEDSPLLLPLESMTWRRIRGGGVQRRAQWYEAWIVTPGDSVPFLPERKAVSGGRPDDGGGR